jgi:hypothetical protein
VFHKDSYIKLLKLLATSIATNGHIHPEKTHILIMTCTEYLPKIQTELNGLNLSFNYFLLDHLTTLIDSACARLDIFNYTDIGLYEKILYLDTDILINGDLNAVFNLDIDSDKLYALEEGVIGNALWGGPELFDFSDGKYDPNTPAFTSGILLFRNSESMRHLFHTILAHIRAKYKSGNFPTMDQPFFVHNAMVQRKYDNQILKQYAENNPSEANRGRIIYHFPGGVGKFATKREKMLDFLNKMSQAKPRNPVKIIQHGEDGFGHQLEGTLRLISLSLNNKAAYQYHLKKAYRFEHANFNQSALEQYFYTALSCLFQCNSSSAGFYPMDTILRETRAFENIIEEDEKYEDYLYVYDGVGCGQKLPANFEMPDEIAKSMPMLRKAFVEDNPVLPPPSYVAGQNAIKTVCCHIRLGDAVGTRPLDNEAMFDVIRRLQTIHKPVQIIVHSDGDVSHLSRQNTTLFGRHTDVLQVLSDFIHADVLIMNYSSLSIAAHLLANPKQIVICPDKAGVTFDSRILKKCIRASTFLRIADTLYL